MNQYKKFYFLRGICFEQITLTSMIGKSEIVRFFRKLIFLRIFSENFKWIQQMLFNSLKITIHIHYCFLKMKNWWSIESFFLNSEFLYSIRYCFFNNLKNTLLFYRSGLQILEPIFCLILYVSPRSDTWNWIDKNIHCIRNYWILKWIPVKSSWNPIKCILTFNE